METIIPMDITVTTFSIAGFAIVPIIVALIEILKALGLPSKFAPVGSVLLGILFGFAALGLSLDGLVIGLVCGLSASGLYSGTKAMFVSKRV